MTESTPPPPDAPTNELVARVRAWMDQLDPDVVRGWFEREDDGYGAERQVDWSKVQTVAIGCAVVMVLLTLVLIGGGGSSNSSGTVSARTIGPSGYQKLEPVTSNRRSDHPEGDRHVYSSGGGGGGGGGGGKGGSRGGFFSVEPCGDDAITAVVKRNTGFGMFSGIHRQDVNCVMQKGDK